MERLLILTEGGGPPGLGHIARCGAIAAAFGDAARMLVHLGGPTALPPAAEALPWREGIEEVAAGLDHGTAVLVDSYLAGPSLYETLCGRAASLTVIDDYGRLVYPADLLIHGGFSAPDYGRQTARVAAGPEYICVRAEVLTGSGRRRHGPLGHLLLTFGGAAGPPMLRALLPVLRGGPWSITAICGRDDEVEVLQDEFAGEDLEILGRVDPADIVERMAACDLAVSAGGQTLHELAFLGVPFVAVQIDEDQRSNVTGYVRSGACPAHLYRGEPRLARRVLDCVEQLTDPRARERQARQGRRMVDGRGAKRIARLLRDGG